VMTANADGALLLVVNDLTSEATAKQSSIALKAAGVDHAMAPYVATGVLYFFDAATFKPIGQITVAHSDAEIKMVIDAAKHKAAKH